MILVDTMIWADHIVRPEPVLMRLLGEGRVLGHPYVIGELALGNLRDRSALARLEQLPTADVAFHDEVMSFIERERLFGAGIGYVDAHLLVASRLSDDATLWTRDKRLHAAAVRCGAAADPPLAP